MLSNCNLFSEGVDIPSVECIILNTFNKSESDYFQKIGRGMRPFTYPDGSKKVLVVLDMGRNCYYHGDIRDDRRWDIDSLATRKRKRTLHKRYCAFCQGELGNTRDIWSRELKLDLDWNNYVIKQLCCMDKSCPTHGENLLSDDGIVIPTSVVAPQPKAERAGLPELTFKKVNSVQEVDMSKATIISIMAKDIKLSKKTFEIMGITTASPIMRYMVLQQIDPQNKRTYQKMLNISDEAVNKAEYEVQQKLDRIKARAM